MKKSKNLKRIGAVMLSLVLAAELQSEVLVCKIKFLGADFG